MNSAEKSRLDKLLNGLDVVELKLPDRCVPVVEEFRSKFQDNSAVDPVTEGDSTTNPYIPDQVPLDEIDRKIMLTIISQGRQIKEASGVQPATCPDPKRPWRVHTCKEKLLRIDNELKRHHEKSSELMTPLTEDKIQALIKCEHPPGSPPRADRVRLQETIELAKKSLPNLKYKLPKPDCPEEAEKAALNEHF